MLRACCEPTGAAATVDLVDGAEVLHAIEAALDVHACLVRAAGVVQIDFTDAPAEAFRGDEGFGSERDGAPPVAAVTVQLRRIACR